MDKWIKVDDGLPEVIVSPDGSVNSVLVYKKGGWECGSDFQVSNTVYVNTYPQAQTHWMPVTPPEEA
ncbi:hypothetical protein LCGC14_2046140 [marine sediment metagenome]|uniref:DUF551 domain-containing protein n=1 Tax=marine sediment metagenome TaxID=412755 RepID=A0A0F9FD13_9ZZZZ